MMMCQDHYNEVQEQEQQQQDLINKVKEEPESLPSESQDWGTLDEPSPPTKVKDQEQLDHSNGQTKADATASQSLPLPMPSDEMLRHSIADSLMEMLVNMTNSHYRRECLELLDASDPLQARSQILNILQRIDMERPQ